MKTSEGVPVEPFGDDQLLRFRDRDGDSQIRLPKWPIRQILALEKPSNHDDKIYR